MRISFVILLSLAANVVLAAVWLQVNHSSPKAVDAVAAAQTETVMVAPSSVVPVDDGATGLNSQARWSDLQVADLREFVRRLRAVGCPEETIKDLVLAELNRSFSKKQRALWQDSNFNSSEYWKPYRQRNVPAELKKNRERSLQMRDMQKEKTALIVELFGVDVEKERRKEEGMDGDWGWNSGNLAYLPESKRDAVQKFLEDFQDKEQEFYASIQGAWDADTRAGQKRLEQEKMDGLAQILTPQELREYALRNSQMASQVQSEIRGVDLTRAQYEALFDIRSKYGDSIYNYGDAGNDADAMKQIEQNKKDLQADIASAVGADKAQQLERAQDYSYQELNRLAKRYGLPADTASKVYDFKGAAETAVKDLSANTDLTSEQRQSALAQIRTETEQAVKTAVGSEKIYKRYVNNGGWWLNNLAPAPPRQN
jgi:2-hydroxychromene-2-carboxylate isomerase